MTSIYIDYPTKEICARTGVTAAERFKHEKPGRRVIMISPSTLSDALATFRGGKFNFGSTNELNDVWIEVDFDDEAFERSIGEYIVRLLGKRYKPLADAPWR